MTAGPKGVAGRPDSLPAQQIAADPLQSYCPDLDQWPASWAYEKRDIPYGLRIVACFMPFLREMLARSLSRKTLRVHRDNIWVLGGELISRVQIDSGLPGGRSSRSSSISSATTADRCSPMASPKPSNAASTQPAASCFAS